MGDSWILKGSLISLAQGAGLGGTCFPRTLSSWLLLEQIISEKENGKLQHLVLYCLTQEIILLHFTSNWLHDGYLKGLGRWPQSKKISCCRYALRRKTFLESLTKPFKYHYVCVYKYIYVCVHTYIRVYVHLKSELHIHKIYLNETNFGRSYQI